MKPFYYIIRVGGKHPQVRHQSIESAHKEALRLAEQHPEASFEIVKFVAVVRCAKPTAFWADGESPPESIES